MCRAIVGIASRSFSYSVTTRSATDSAETCGAPGNPDISSVSPPPLSTVAAVAAVAAVAVLAAFVGALSTALFPLRADDATTVKEYRQVGGFRHGVY